MNVQVTEEQGWARTLLIDVPYDELKPGFEKALKKIRKDAKMEGFRKGKVPMGIIKRLYGAQVELDSLGDVLPEILHKAFVEKELKVVTRPTVNKIDFHPGSDLSLEVRVEVEPEFELKKYENFKFDYDVYEVTEDDIAEAIERIREEYSNWKTLEDEPAAEDDHVVLDMQKLDESGMPLVGKKTEEYFPLSDGGELTEIGRQLLGAKKGETRKIVYAAPDDDDPEAPVAPGPCEVTVKEVYRQVLPDIDDELAKDTGEFETLEEMKKGIGEKIRTSAQKNFDDVLYEKIIDKLIENNPFDLPEGMIEERLDELITELREEAERTGGEVDEDEARRKYRDMVVSQIKWQLIRDKLIKHFDIKVEDDAVRKEFEKLTAEYNLPNIDAAWESFRLDFNQYSRLAGRVLSQRLFEELKSRQKLKEKKITIKDIRKANEKRAKKSA